MSDFNPQKARTKYALSIWVDAFVRKTLELSIEEIGAYHMILYAMWGRESLDFPDDDTKLARVCRVTARQWRTKFRPTLEPFFEVQGGVWTNHRLQIEAAKTEEFLKAQSERRKKPCAKSSDNADFLNTDNDGENSEIVPANPLINNNPLSTVDATTDQTTDPTGEHPTQETKRLLEDLDAADASASAGKAISLAASRPGFREQILTACNVDPVSGLTGIGGRQIGTQADMIEGRKWITDLGLTEAEVIAEVTRIISGKRDGPPSSFRYFTNAMRELAGAKAAAPLAPVTPQSPAHFQAKPTETPIHHRLRPQIPKEFSDAE